jgi:GTPase SAR1 family protein
MLKIDKNIKHKSKPKVLFILGPIASGKTTLAERLGLNDFLIVNPDIYFEPRLKSSFGTMKYAELTKSQLSSAARLMVYSVIKAKEDFIRLGESGENILRFSTSGSIEAIAEENEWLKSLGYSSVCIMLDTPYSECLARSQSREKSLPDEVIRQSHAKIVENMQNFKDYFGQSFISVRYDFFEEDFKFLKDKINVFLGI